MMNRSKAGARVRPVLALRRRPAVRPAHRVDAHARRHRRRIQTVAQRVRRHVRIRRRRRKGQRLALVHAPVPDRRQHRRLVDLAHRHRQGLTVAATGAVGEATGISEDGEWFVVKLPTTVVSDGQGWVSAAYVIAENTSGLPVVEAPPLP